MSFTDQKSFVVTEKDLTALWGGYRDGRSFRCFLCGHFFGIGDTARWVYTNSTPGAHGNPFVCSKCDGPDVMDRIIALNRDARRLLWWFVPEHYGVPNPHTVALKKERA
jgi:formate-dependent nitrite reductase cytochrome c552 subunit